MKQDKQNQEFKSLVSLKPELITEKKEKMVESVEYAQDKIKKTPQEDIDARVKYVEMKEKYMLEESTRIAQEEINRRAEDARFAESRTMKNEHDSQHNISKHSNKHEKDLAGHLDDTNMD